MNTVSIKRLYNRVSVELGLGFPALCLGNLVIYANSFCNAHCPFCDVGTRKKTGINSQNQSSSLYLSIELFSKILDDELVVKLKPSISFLMTEPLLNEELPILLKMAHNNNHRISVTTNGFLLPQKAELIGSALDELQVSLDGLEQTHDSIRGRNFFSNAIEGMKQINSKYPNVKLTVNYTVTPLSCTEFFELAQYLNENVKLHRFKIQFMDFVSAETARKHNEIIEGIFQGESACDLLDRAGEMDMQSLFEMLQKIRNSKFDNIGAIKIIPDIKSVEDVAQYFSREVRPFGRCTQCYWPFTQVAINTNGDVFWHMRCFNDYVLGNINAANLTEIFVKGQKAKYFRKKFRASNFLFPACVRCCGAMQHQRRTKRELFHAVLRKINRKLS